MTEVEVAADMRWTRGGAFAGAILWPLAAFVDKSLIGNPGLLDPKEQLCSTFGRDVIIAA
jgi:hypothetical protein